MTASAIVGQAAGTHGASRKPAPKTPLQRPDGAPPTVAGQLERSGNEASDWTNKALHALVEARVMSESIGQLVEMLIDGSDRESFPLLEAVHACLIRLDKSVDPLLDCRPADRVHEAVQAKATTTSLLPSATGPLAPFLLLREIDRWLANTGHGDDHPWRVSIAKTLRCHSAPGGGPAQDARSTVTLDAGAARAVRFAVLTGMQSFGEIERLRNLWEVYSDRVPEGMRPEHPTGDAETTSKFAAALLYLEPSAEVCHG